jgi:transposase, IS605 orfB family
MLKTIKLKLYPTSTQMEKIEYLFKARQWLWNYFVERNNEIIKENEKITKGLRCIANKTNGLTPILGAYNMNREMIKIRKETKELQMCLVDILRKTTNNLECIYKQYYKYNRNLPKHSDKLATFTIAVQLPPSVAHRAYFVNSKHKMYLSGLYPKRIKLKTLLQDRREGIRYRGYVNKKEIKELKEVTVKKDKLGHYYACVVYEVKEEYLKKVKGNKSIGIDLGIKKFLTDSKGNKAIGPDYNRLLKRIDSLKSIQDTLEDNSKQYRINRLWDRIVCSRRGFLHQLSSYYTSIYKNIYIEDLSIRQMLSNTNSDSNNYIAKAIGRKLHKGIHNQGWGTFINMLKYKSNYYGNNLIEVDPKFTSQTCYICKHVDKNSRQGEVFQCTKCGYVNDADINAAKNILEKGK